MKQKSLLKCGQAEVFSCFISAKESSQIFRDMQFFGGNCRLEIQMCTDEQLNSLQQNLSVFKKNCFLFSQSTDGIYSLFIKFRYTKLWVGFDFSLTLFFKENK